jgi:hypothetical protein
VPLRIVELPIKNKTGLFPMRVEPGAGRLIKALAMESGVLSTTLLTSSIGSGRLSKPCANTGIKQTININRQSILLIIFIGFSLFRLQRYGFLLDILACYIHLIVAQNTQIVHVMVPNVQFL